MGSGIEGKARTRTKHGQMVERVLQKLMQLVEIYGAGERNRTSDRRFTKPFTHRRGWYLKPLAR